MSSDHTSKSTATQGMSLIMPKNQQPPKSPNQSPDQQNLTMFPPTDPNRTAPNRYGIIYDNHIYAILTDSDLGREYENLESKQEKRQFSITNGEKRERSYLIRDGSVQI
ncbi:hypothetical protein EJ02DRAFT_420783 [Clathrospora elynae]|uniref:Uncharacterized protein n=1 Tax=Clathrospora elynae TaxID=706981 RepID=A0A6A5SXC5_9PLEO|nr:hypothetical protein EJ02DRAFT_420783 [Clathrospora elynae]